MEWHQLIKRMTIHEELSAAEPQPKTTEGLCPRKSPTADFPIILTSESHSASNDESKLRFHRHASDNARYSEQWRGVGIPLPGFNNSLGSKARFMARN